MLNVTGNNTLQWLKWAEPLGGAVILFFIFTFGTVVNALVFLIFYKKKPLRSISNRFVLSLTSANLISTMVVVPIQAIRLFSRIQVLVKEERGVILVTGAAEDYYSLVWKALTTLSVQAAIFSVLVIAVDRYCAVTSPLHYSMTVTRDRSVRLIVAVWIIALMYAVPPLLARLGTLHHQPTRLCTLDPEIIDVKNTVWTFNLYYSTFLLSIGLILPFLVLCWIYVKMYQTAQRNSQRTRRHSISTNPQELILPECPSTPESTLHSSLKGKTKVTRKRSSNNSNLSLFFREEGRAMKTGVIVTVSFIISWAPFYCYMIIERSVCHHPYIEDLVILLALTAPCFLPFIYVYRNGTARIEAMKVVCWWRTFDTLDNSFQRSSVSNRLSNGHSEMPVRIIGPDGASLYSYAAECKECGANQIVSSMKPCPPPSPNDPISRITGMPRRQSTVSFKLSPLDKQTKCRQCLRQDSASSASSDDPLLLDRWRYPRHSTASIRWNRQRMSNGSVTTRSNSLASTNSSVLSVGTHRYPGRRFSAVSTDSGATVLKKDESDDGGSNITLRRLSCQRPLFPDEPSDITEVDETIEFHGYNNPLKDTGFHSLNSSNRVSPSRMSYGSADSNGHLKFPMEAKSVSLYSSKQASPNFDRLQLPGDHVKINVCQIHPKPGYNFKTALASPEKMCIDGSPDLRNGKKLLRTKSNPKFLRVSVVEHKNNRITTRLEKDGLAFKSDSNLNGCEIGSLRETYSAE